LIRPDDGAMRMMDLEEKKAVVTDSRGSAELTRRDDGDFVRIVDTEGKLLYEGILGDRPEQSLCLKVGASRFVPCAAASTTRSVLAPHQPCGYRDRGS
jgi:hypothetical protein